MNNILSNVFVFFTGFLTQFVNIITKPVLKVLELFLPRLDDYVANFQSFFTNYICKGFQFTKMVFINITGINHNVFNFIVISFFIFVYLTFVIVAIKFVYNAWRIIHGTQNI